MQHVVCTCSALAIVNVVMFNIILTLVALIQVISSKEVQEF